MPLHVGSTLYSQLSWLLLVAGLPATFIMSPPCQPLASTGSATDMYICKARHKLERVRELPCVHTYGRQPPPQAMYCMRQDAVCCTGHTGQVWELCQGLRPGPLGRCQLTAHMLPACTAAARCVLHTHRCPHAAPPCPWQMPSARLTSRPLQCGCHEVMQLLPGPCPPSCILSSSGTPLRGPCPSRCP